MEKIIFVLTKQGCLIDKKSLTETELFKIKTDLKVQPIIHGNFGTTFNNSFKIYKENKDKLVVPTFYAKKNFNNTFKIKYNSGTNIKFKSNIFLRDYQKPAVDTIIDKLKKESGTILSVPCAFGKTIVAIHMIHLLKKKTLVVVHNDYLLTQWKDRIESTTNAKIGYIKQNKIETDDCDIVIAMLQSISMRDYSNDIFNEFGFVIFDECHHLGAKCFSQALFKLNSTYMLGLSATPDRKDGLTKVFKYFLGEIGYCVKQEYTFNVDINIHTIYFDNEYYKDVFSKIGNINTPGMINNLVLCEERNNYIINLVDEVMKEPRNLLILTDRRDQVLKLYENLNEKYSVGYVIGQMKEDHRNESLTKNIIIGTYQMVSEGFDVDRLDTLIFATPKVSIEQAVGRILRKQQYTYNPLVIDIVDKLNVFKNQGYARKRFYNKNNYNIKYFSNEENDKKIKKTTIDKYSYNFQL